MFVDVVDALDFLASQIPERVAFRTDKLTFSGGIPYPEICEVYADGRRQVVWNENSPDEIFNTSALEIGVREEAEARGWGWLLATCSEGYCGTIIIPHSGPPNQFEGKASDSGSAFALALTLAIRSVAGCERKAQP